MYIFCNLCNPWHVTILCNNSKPKRMQRYLGFLAYILSACGLSSTWAKLIQNYLPCRFLFKTLFSRLLQVWKDCHLKEINWACDVPIGDMAIVDQRDNLRWHSRHTQHINIAEAMALTKAVTIMPNNTTVWINSKVTMGWTRCARRGWPVSAVLSWLLVTKGIQVNWIPSAWNLANRFTRMELAYAKKVGHCK